MTTSSQHAAVIPWSGISLFDGVIMVQHEAIGIPRLGVG